jgi:lipoprotein-anchoring transpeptidase ErfK/SrfK
MNFRTAGALATLFFGLAGSADQADAQYYPPPQAYPPQTYPPQQGYPPYRPGPPPALEEDDDAPFYDPSMVQRRPLPPPGVVGQQPADPLPGAGVRSGRGAPVYPEEEVELLPPPPGYFYREGRQGYELSTEPNARVARPNYTAPPGVAPALPPPAGAQPGLPVPPGQDAVRPPMSIGPGQVDPGQTGAIRPDPRMAALPPDVRPETGPAKELPPQFRRAQVDYRTKEPAGTLIVDTQNTYLYLVLGNGKAMRYGIGVGREGFTWNGTEKVSRMAEWPDWNPPEEMIDRQPYLPRFMAGGPGNPLGARALYLGKTIYRIHGTNQPSTIGTFVSSGCIRLVNEDVTDLYTRVKVGTRVVVLPGKAPATAAATPIAPPAAAAPIAPPATVRPGAPAVTTAPLAPPPSAMAR